MKKLFLSLFVFTCLAGQVFGQIRTPQPSPTSETKQTVGLTEVSLVYSRPSVKGRTIFTADGLVPHGEIWRLGANQATKISFSDDVKVGGKAIKGGDYALLSKPNEKSWEIMFFPYETGNWGSYVEKTPAATVKVDAQALPFSVESFTMMLGDLTSNTANLYVMWDKTAIAIPIEAEVDKKVMAGIDKVMAGPSANDYYAAASYYHDAGKDLNKALEMIQKATKVEKPAFWQVRREALILADLGKKDAAIEAAKKSKALAEKAGNKDYVRMNEKSIKEWTSKK
jgi:hypothetical protein